MQIEKDKELLALDEMRDEEEIEEELLAEEGPSRNMRPINVTLGVLMVLFLIFTVISVYVILHQPPDGVTEDSIYQGFIPLHAVLRLSVW